MLEALPPPDPTLHKVGREDGGQRGAKQRTLLEHFGLRRETNLLEIGCGVGRLPYELAYFFDGGSYTGFDVSEVAIGWLNEHYAPRRPHFRFDLIDVHSPRYNPDGGSAADTRFPYADRSFDMVCAFEVFMHMERDDVEGYLREINRVLTDDGCAIVTFMAILDPSAPNVHAGREFVPIGDGVYTRFPERKGWSLAFDESLIRTMLATAGFSVTDWVEGQWHHPWELSPGELQHGCDLYALRRAG